MYNRYIPTQTKYEAAGAGPSAPSPSRGGLGALLNGLGKGGTGAGDGIGQAVSALMKRLHLDGLDTGDILLGLIVLFLVLEDGDDLDLIITLGLTILFSLGEK